jgi:hypothetical protein
VNPTQHYVAEFVDSFPTPMQPGVLYVSTTYSMAGHICPSGCGREVTTKLSPARYKIIYDGEISLKPSVAATGLPCNSHYFIARGEVDWHDQLDARQTQRARTADRQTVEQLRPVEQDPSVLLRLWRKLRRQD